jgi:hypothetical protein
MTITATVQSGKIILPPEVDWPTGSVVRVELVEEPLPTLYEILKDFDGMASDMPPDLAANLDHYLHGHDRK